jgi:FkbM family methyltransferase
MRERLQRLLKGGNKKFRDTFAKCSFSQYGEDMIVDGIFRMRRIVLPTYLDIGANHPFFLNNTVFFYEKGSSGINVEANPFLISNFEKYRVRDRNLNVGIDKTEGELDFFIMEDDTLSTFSSIEKDHLIRAGKALKEVRKIRLITVSKLLETYTNNVFPDFLSLDVEGFDLNILESIDYNKSSPKVICVEAAEFSIKGTGKRRDELVDFLVGNNYYEYANTNLNAIMVRRDFWFI